MNHMKNAIIIALLVIIAVLAVVFIPKKDDQDAVAVNSFIECSEAGYPILETFPEQCRTPDGRVFTDDLNETVDVVISTPERGGLVTSPLTVSGKARGNWFFEANLPVTLKDETGKVLAQVGAMTSEDWMTTEFVNFTTVLNFQQPTTEFGVLLIEKDNPSGLPENDASYAIPVRFR